MSSAVSWEEQALDGFKHESDLNINKSFLPVFQDYVEQNHTLYLLGGGRGRGASEFIRSVGGLLMNGKLTPYKVRILLLRATKESIKKTLFKGFMDKIDDRKLKKNKGDYMDNSRMTFKKNGNELLVESFHNSGGSDQKLKSYVNLTHIFIEELQEVQKSSLFDMILTTANRSFVDKDTGILVKPQVMCAFNMPEKSHWLIRDFFDLEPSDYDGYYKAIIKPDIQKKMGVYYHFSTVYENTGWMKTLEKIGEDYKQQQLYLNYERFKDTNPHQYYTETLGLVSSGRSGTIFKDWKQITKEDWDKIDVKPIIGMDFGYQNSRTAITGIKRVDNTLFVHTFVYARRLNDSGIYRRIKKLIENYADLEYFGDRQNQDKIDYLFDCGLNIKSVKKGAGSVVQGVDYLRSFKVFYTIESCRFKGVNGEFFGLDRELSTYAYALDNDGKLTNHPIKGKDDIIDSIRYGVYQAYHPSNQSFFDRFYSDENLQNLIRV